MRLLSLTLATLLTSEALAVPQVLNHQGRIAVSGINFTGNGQFKFALVNRDGSVSYWSHDGTSIAGGEPSSNLSASVSKGLYSVLLGEGMEPLDSAIFNNDELFLRVWFNDGVNGFQQLAPDQRQTPAPYAQVAERVTEIMVSDLLDIPATPVIAWGNNTNGETSVPTDLSSVIDVAASENFSIAVLSDGLIRQWGTGATPPADLSDVTSVAAGSNHALALREDGSIVGWGDNTFGQANGVPGPAGYLAVAAGEKHSIGIRPDQTIAAWGDNSFGQINVPNGLTNIRTIAAGYDHTLALKSDNTVVAWGRDNVGQATIPAGLTNVTAIAAGAYHSLAVKSDGTVVAWGWNFAGQTDVPAGLSNVISVNAGYGYSYALKQDGTVISWGDNANGQRNIPSDLNPIAQVAAGPNHVLVRTRDRIPAQLARLDTDNHFRESIGVGRFPAVNSLEVQGQASKTTAGNWFANSDARIKTEVLPVNEALDTLDRVRLVSFRYTEDHLNKHPSLRDRRYLNVIAQEFAEVFPQHVQGSGEFLSDGSEILQVDTYPLTIYSAAAIQELRQENTKLSQRLIQLERRLDRMETLIRKDP